MDLGCMPALVIEEVAVYLTLNDVIACSGVSRQWRRAFDSDRIWKRYSTFHKDYLKKQVTNQRSSSQDFIDGCNAKKYVFKELQVGKNVVEGKHDLVQVNIGRVYCDNLLDLVDDFGNHWLFISCAKNFAFESVHMIEVWNVNDKPIKHQSIETPFGITKRMFDSQMRAYKNKLYYWESNVLIAFEFSHPEYSLTFIFKIDCPVLEGARNHNAMVCKPNMVLAFVFTDVHSHLSTVPWIHVWGMDVNTLYKNYSADEVDHMKTQIAQNHESVAYSKRPTFFIVKDGGSSNNVLLAYGFLSHGHVSTISVVLFNIRTFKLTTLFAQVNGDITMGWDFILDNQTVLVYYSLCTSVSQVGCSTSWTPKLLFYSTDGNLIYESIVSSFKHCHIFRVVDSKKVFFIEGDSSVQVSVFDVVEGREIYSFRLPKHAKKEDFQESFSFIQNNLGIVQERKKNKITLAVWDFKHGGRLYSFKRLNEPAKSYMFNFSKSYRTPTKIFGIKDPNYYYSSESNGEIVMISFL